MSRKINTRSKSLALVAAYLLLSCPGLLAQSGDPGYYTQAFNLFTEKSYYQAAQVFEKYLQSEKRPRSSGSPFAVEKKHKGKANLNMHQESIYDLAECYRQLHDFVSAEKYYQMATKFPEHAYPLTNLWLGVCMRVNQKYDSAFYAISKFEESYTEMGPNLIRADRELESLKYIKSEMTKSTKNYLIEQQPNSGNTSAYALAVQQNDTVVFTSIHMDSAALKKGQTLYNNNLYQSVTGEDLIARSVPFSLPYSRGQEQTGLACFTPDANHVFFTHWTKTHDQTSSAIFESIRSDSGWSAPRKLAEPVNVEGSNSTQPFVTDDGKYLLFASDRPGGFGGYDIWYASLDSNYEPTIVDNLGETINGPGDEEAPYFHSKTRTLVFASNGRVGMGGFDIYYAHGSYDLTRWEKPKNPGIPINSTKDDIYFISTDKENMWNTGWLSSDRATDCCLALFSVKENNDLLIRGQVVDCTSKHPLVNASVIFLDPRHGNRIIGRRITDSLGRYEYSLKNISVIEAKAEKEGYTEDEKFYTVELEPGRDTLNTAELCIEPLKTDIKVVNKMLEKLNQAVNVGNFEYKKAKLTAGTNSQLDGLADLMKKYPDIIVEIGGYTDGIGGVAYNLKLAQARVNVSIDYLVKHGVDPKRLKGKAYGKCCPIAPDLIDGKDNPAGRALNRRVEYKLIN